MLKTLGIVFVALALVGFNGNPQAQKKTEAKKNQPPTSPVVPITSVQSPAVNKSNTQTPAPEREKHVDADVRIIQTPAKDGFDKASIGLNAVLALVGIAGIAISAVTLFFLRKQWSEMRYQRLIMRRSLHSMRKQTELIHSQAELMKRQADLMEKQNAAIQNRERARLSVEFPPKSDPDFVTPWRSILDEEIGPEMDFSFTVHVHNYGISKAFNVRAEMNFRILPKTTPFNEDFFSSVPIPNVIGEVVQDSPVPVRYSTYLPVKEIEQINEGNSSLYVYGNIHYRDVFGDKRVTPFRFMWEVVVWNDGEQGYGSWENQTGQKPAPESTTPKTR
jgi:hypothetical protein